MQNSSQISFDIPILLIVFNRLEQTKIVFEEIKKIRPTKLYISADGPRQYIKNEDKITSNIHNYLINNIDWPCDVSFKRNEINKGCRVAVSEGITWFFENEEMGIILEDDCLPSSSFFKLCKHLLLKYKDDKTIWHISGNTVIPEKFSKKYNTTYYFSIFNHIWGWATWSDRWKYYDVDLKNIDNIDFLKKFFTKPKEINYWSNIFKKIQSNDIDTWDYQWTFTCWKNNALSIVPKINLITNIGFGKDATHTLQTNSTLENLEKFEINEIIDTDDIKRNIMFDKYVLRKIFIPSTLDKILNRLKQTIRIK